MDGIERIENKLDKMDNKIDTLLESKGRNDERLKGQQRQLTGIWMIIFAAVGAAIKKLFFV